MLKLGNIPPLVALAEPTDLKRQKATNKGGIYLFRNHGEKRSGNYTSWTFCKRNKFK